MEIQQYYSNQDGVIRFTQQQASDFAKQVANDFNPIHDADATRFCVPGDLLFAVTLNEVGLSQCMRIHFADMVSDGTALTIKGSTSAGLKLVDEAGKAYLDVQRDGDMTRDAALINQFVREYVEFSGKAFPHTLVSLWEKQNVMINPSRPLVIYESMAVDLERLDIKAPVLQMADTSFEIEGKRGNVSLAFNILEANEVIGRGEKRMVCSGLRAFDKTKMDELIQVYNDRRATYLASVQIPD